MLFALSLLLLASSPSDGGAVATHDDRPIRIFGDLPKPQGGFSDLERSEAGGVPMRLSAVRSAASIEELQAYFEERFRQRRFYRPPPEHLTQYVSNPRLVGLDPETMRTWVVFFQPNPDRSTTVIIGEAQPDEYRPTAADDLAPVFPSATGVITTRSEAGASVSYLALAPAKRVASFYRDVLQAAGFTHEGEGVFTEPNGGELRVALSAEGERTHVTVLVRPSAR